MSKFKKAKRARQSQSTHQPERQQITVKDTDGAMFYLRANLNLLRHHQSTVSTLTATLFDQLAQIETFLHHEEDGFTIQEMLEHLGGLEGVVRIQKALSCVIGMLMTYPDLLEDAHAQIVALSQARAVLREKEALAKAKFTSALTTPFGRGED